MNKHLTTYINQRNFLQRAFNKPEYVIENLTAADNKELLHCLESDLSPENLCCDGELSGALLHAKTNMLRGAMYELLKPMCDTFMRRSSC